MKTAVIAMTWFALALGVMGIALALAGDRNYLEASAILFGAGLIALAIRCRS